MEIYFFIPEFRAASVLATDSRKLKRRRLFEMFGLVCCPSCGGNLGVVAPAYAYALAQLERSRGDKVAAGPVAAAVSSGFAGFAPGTACGPLLDALGLSRVCCRMHMLTHVKLADVFGPALAGPDDARTA